MDILPVRLGCYVHCLDNADFSREITIFDIPPATNLSTVFFNSLGFLSSGCLRQSRDDLTSDNDAICDLGNAQEVVSCANTKANSSWDVTRVFLDPLQQVGQGCVHSSGSTCDAHS